MKKLLSAVLVLLSVAVLGCTTVSAYDEDIVSVGKTGGVIIDSGASAENQISQTAAETDSLPSNYNSVDKGYVTSVKNQSSQNTCIFFASMSAMETALLKNGYGEYDLSEEHANYWSAMRSDGKGWQRDKATGGSYPMTAMGYLTSPSGGSALETELPYMSSSAESFEELVDYEPQFYAGSISTYSGASTNAAEIKKAIMNNGGVAGSFTFHVKYLNSNNRAYNCPDTLAVSSISSGAHAVFVVGWDDDYSVDNFNSDYRPAQNGAWLIKNSWGSYYDYIWVSYEDKYFGSELFGKCYSVDSVIKNHSCNELISVDDFGAVYCIDFQNELSNPNDVTFINTYEFTKEMPSISNVTFTNENIGSEYEIYYIPTTDGTPATDSTEWTKLASGTVENDGVHNVSFKAFTAPQGMGAVGVRIITDGSVPASIGCCEWVSNSGMSSYLFLPRTQDNRSFVVSGDESFSLTEYYQAMDDSIGGNFVINAVVNVRLGDVDKNGEISILDAILLQKHFTKISILDTDTVTYVADVDSNGEIRVADTIAVQKAAMKIVEL